MKYHNLFVVLTLKDIPEKFPAEDYRYNQDVGHNELLITLFGQKLWVDTHYVKLMQDFGATFCWKEREQGKFIELNQSNSVCPECGWLLCHVCSSCRCNKS